MVKTKGFAIASGIFDEEFAGFDSGEEGSTAAVFKCGFV
jgi:hypothetical protein